MCVDDKCTPSQDALWCNPPKWTQEVVESFLQIQNGLTADLGQMATKSHCACVISDNSPLENPTYKECSPETTWDNELNLGSGKIFALSILWGLDTEYDWIKPSIWPSLILVSSDYYFISSIKIRRKLANYFLRNIWTCSYQIFIVCLFASFPFTQTRGLIAH